MKLKPSEKLKSYFKRKNIDISCAVYYFDDNREIPLFILHTEHTQKDVNIFLSTLDKFENWQIGRYCVVWDKNNSYYIFTEDYESVETDAWYWQDYEIILPPKFLK